MPFIGEKGMRYYFLITSAVPATVIDEKVLKNHYNNYYRKVWTNSMTHKPGDLPDKCYLTVEREYSIELTIK